MSATLDISLQQLYGVVGRFIQSVVGNTVPVVQGQENRESMPAGPFILMQAMVSGAVRTNVDRWNPVTQVQSSERGTKVKVQIDCYGASSNSWATMLATLWRDYYGCDFMKPTCQPLYTGDPFQGALVDGEEQYEERWTVVGYVQYNPVTTFAQQSATALAVNVINVDERYKP